MAGSRIEPTPEVNPLHLHEWTQKEITEKGKSPDGAIYDGNEMHFGGISLGDISMSNMFDPKTELQMALSFLLKNFQTLQTLVQGDFFPDWFVLFDEGADIHDVTITGGVLNLILTGLPTSDPGGGKAWLSAT